MRARSAVTRKMLLDYGVAIVAAVTVALLIRFFVIEAYRIPTPAMRPTLEPGDTIFVSKSPIGFNGQVDRGDVIIFESPTEIGRDYIKRVLGLPGDLVEVRQGRLSLNGRPLAVPSGRKNAPCGQERIPQSGRTYTVCREAPLSEDFGPEKVPEGSVFVLGDLRSQNPAESKKQRRGWGMIPAANIKGKALWTWLSIEPQPGEPSIARFPNFRFERMLRRID